jgi:hypothetical protein
MSNEKQAQNDEAVLPDVQTAYNTLFDGVHQQVFFNKLASYGFVPQNEKEAAEMLELAGKLRYVEGEEEKAAADESRVSQANVALDNVLGIPREQGEKRAAAEDESAAISQAAAQLAEEPAFYNSVLALKAAEAASYADQQAPQE